MNYDFDGKTGLIAGGTKGIGFAVAKSLCEQNKLKKLYILGRDFQSETLLRLKEQHAVEFIPLDFCSDNKENTLTDFVSSLDGPIDFIINCVGVLKLDPSSPERRLEDISYDNFIKNIEVNTYPTLLLAKVFKTKLLASQAPLFLSVSAKVGSLTDNRLGGWHSYRISKAALNMSIKNISLEFKNRNKNSLVFAYHPGTTDTDLSAPFLAQASKKYTIHSAEQSGENLLKNIKTTNHGKLISWDEVELPW